MRRALPLLAALSALAAGCGLGPFREAAITSVHQTCAEQSVSTRDVTDAREAERRIECGRTRTTEDCTPIPTGAKWIRTDACRHAQRWLCQTEHDGVTRCQPDTAEVSDETP